MTPSGCHHGRNREKTQRLKPLRVLLYKSRQVIQQGMGDTEPETETERLSSESEIRKRYNPQTAAAQARPCERRTDGIDSPIAQLVRALH